MEGKERVKNLPFHCNAFDRLNLSSENGWELFDFASHQTHITKGRRNTKRINISPERKWGSWDRKAHDGEWMNFTIEGREWKAEKSLDMWVGGELAWILFPLTHQVFTRREERKEREKGKSSPFTWFTIHDASHCEWVSKSATECTQGSRDRSIHSICDWLSHCERGTCGLWLLSTSYEERTVWLLWILYFLISLWFSAQSSCVDQLSFFQERSPREDEGDSRSISFRFLFK